VLRHIRVGSTDELRQRIFDAIEEINRAPVIHRWTYAIQQPVRGYESVLGNGVLVCRYPNRT
jgi:hypothetical protein